VPEIRALVREDIPQVTNLYQRVARSGAPASPRGLSSYFMETFLDHPWVDTEIPSLVYEDDDGEIAGFLGSSVRRFLFDGRPIRACVSGQLVTDPHIRKRAAGAFLMRACMDGAQELTLTDGASYTVERIWSRLGGEASQLACVDWLRVLRPWQFGRDVLAHRRGREPRLYARGKLLPLLDAVTLAVSATHLRPTPTQMITDLLTARAATENLPELAEPFRLRPDYDEGFLAWLFRELAAVTRRGKLVSRLVRNRERGVRGWYVYYLRPGGISHVLQIVGSGHGLDDVVAALFEDAWSSGAAALQGRVEGHLREPLARARCFFRASDSLALIHSRDRELLHAIQSGRGLLTRMEGEWWMGHHLQPFQEPGPGTT
jgi:hypothetical protein